MTDAPKPVRIGVGDPVSQLLQLIAGDLGVRRTFIGRGRDDIRALLVELQNVTVKAEEAWKALKELFDMPELQELPEPIQVKLMAGILQARANIELRSKV